LARADGYLKKRYVDIGDKVNAGQLLAEIAAPDLDQQVEQGRAQLLQARASLRQAVAALEQGHANQNLARVTAVRWSALLKRGAVSPQDNDTQQANFQAQTANVGALEEAVGAAQENAKAAQANLDRLVNLQSYEKVRAPYNGVITLRNVDDGALISTAQTLLFRVAQIDRLRTYLYVPEANAHLVQVGHRASLSLAEFPGRPFTGEITRTSNSLDPMTRTLLVEVQIPNGNHALFPGMFSEVSLKQTRVNPPVLVPADALIVQPTGTFIAVLEGDAKGEREAQPEKSKEGDKKKKTSEKDDRKEKESLLKQQQELPTFTVHLAPVTVGRDYGNAIEIATGLQGNERIVPNPNDHVRENVTVKGQKSKDNPVNPAPQPGKANANGEQLAPQPNAEPVPKDPAKTRMDRGPGY
jgi:RND family efflux transporter MFP subunit